MVRLTGFVVVEGRKVSLDWTLMPDNAIISSGDLSPTSVNCTGMTLPPAQNSPPPAPVAPASTPTPPPANTPLDYASMNKTELMTLCSQRGLSTTGTKADLIARLEADDSGETETEAVSEGETDEESQPE